MYVSQQKDFWSEMGHVDIEQFGLKLSVLFGKFFGKVIHGTFSFRELA